MYKKHTAYGTTVHTFEFNPELYNWTIEIGKSGQLESLQQIAPNADYVINWSVFDWGNGKNGYGRIQNGTNIIQGSSVDFPTISFTDGKLVEGECPNASPGFARWRVLVRKGTAVVDFVADGNQRVKDARSAVGQLTNGNIVLITVEGDDTKKKGLTGQELGQFAVDLGCVFCCDCDGGGSAACKSKDGYIYNQGRAIAGAMVVRRKTMLEMCLPKVGCGYVWGSQGEMCTKEFLNKMAKMFGSKHYYFEGFSAEKWLGKQVFDCSGLIVWAGNLLGILKGDYTAAGLYNLCDKVTTPVAGDLCFNDGLTHVGIYAGNGKYLHAKGTRDGVVITDKYTFTKFGRLKGVNGMGWDEKNKEFVKTVQKVIGVEADGLAGNKTIAAFEGFAKAKSGANAVLKELLNKAIELLK